ncbi:MAG: hypothetical protein KIT84_42950 [Labilithrix sp.]|nr:hypothetical protein [Labilithrix sp.]MCW5817838.1 hypothetical protein [Labilithrix sp.]
MLRWYVLGGSAVFLLAAASCADEYAEDEAPGADGGSDVAADVEEAPDPDGGAEADAESDVSDASDASDAGIDVAEAAADPTFCTGKSAALCVDFEERIAPPTGCTFPPTHYGTTRWVEGSTSPTALEVLPNLAGVDAGTRGAGASIECALEKVTTPRQVDVSFRFRIATIKNGADFARVDVGGGNGFHLNISDGTQGYQLIVWVDVAGKGTQSAAFLIDGSWHEVTFTAFADGRHHLFIDKVPRGLDGYLEPLGPHPMAVRLGSYLAGPAPTSSTYEIATVQLDELVVALPP